MKIIAKFSDLIESVKRDFSEQYANELIVTDQNSQFFTSDHSENTSDLSFLRRISKPIVFQFSYYPAIRNITGGERRINAIRKVINGLGFNLKFGGIYKYKELRPLGNNCVELSKRQYKWVQLDWRAWEVRLAYAALASRVDIEKLDKIFTSVQPDVLLIEHPYLWPFIKHNYPNIPVIYDSHNVEWELKEKFLDNESASAEIIEFYRDIEKDLVLNSCLVLCCSVHDFNVYKFINKKNNFGSKWCNKSREH